MISRGWVGLIGWWCHSLRLTRLKQDQVWIEQLWIFFFSLFCFSEHSTHNYLTFMSYNSTIQPTHRFVSLIYFFHFGLFPGIPTIILLSLVIIFGKHLGALVNVLNFREDFLFHLKGY